MGSYIKINGWSGSNKEDSALRFAKVFRLSKVETESAMGQISQGMTWQFGKTISDRQSAVAKNFLTGIGFNVELVSDSPMEWPGTDSPAAEELPQAFEEVEEFPGKPTRKPKAKAKRGKKVMAGVVIVLLILAAGGLSQTQFGKDLIESIGSKSNDLINKFETSSNEKESSPASPPPQSAEIEIPENLPTVKPLQGIVFKGKPKNKYPMTLGGCRVGENQLNLILLRADLEQTQRDFFCKDKTIANPQAGWKCEFKPNSKMCQGKESFSCVRHYHCIPETPEFNKAKFGKEVENLENLENQIKTGLTNLTYFRGLAVDSKYMGRNSSSISNCYTGDVLRDKLLRTDLKQTQENFFCKGKTIANPVGGWKCELGQTSCGGPGEKHFICSRSYQCIPETADYNRVRFKKEIEALP